MTTQRVLTIDQPGRAWAHSVGVHDRELKTANPFGKVECPFRPDTQWARAWREGFLGFPVPAEPVGSVGGLTPPAPPRRSVAEPANSARRGWAWK